MIVNPITLAPENRIHEAQELMKKYRISGVPITEGGRKEGRLLGILTNRDLRFETNIGRPISDGDDEDPLFTVPVGTTLEDAREILHQHKVEKLLVVDADFRLKGLITVKDIQKMVKYPNACKDSLGRLRVAAAVGIAKDTMERAEALVAATWTPSSWTRRTATRRTCSTSSSASAVSGATWTSSPATWRRRRRPRR
jgi:IMP dehydrogenase